jgi:hypothetical protein
MRPQIKQFIKEHEREHPFFVTVPWRNLKGYLTLTMYEFQWLSAVDYFDWP